MKKLTLKNLRALKAEKSVITCCTAYDYASIRLMEDAEIDILIPDDWGISVTLLGNPSAAQVGMREVLFYLEAVVRTARRGYILAPMPYGSYEISNEDALRNSTTLQKAGADGVILQGSGKIIERVQALTEVGVPCVGHLGYTPHRMKCLGPDRIVGATAEEAAQLLDDARKLEAAGAWGVILQNVPDRVAAEITSRTTLITIASGATRGCDGAFVRAHALLGWPEEQPAPFTPRYGEFKVRALAALKAHIHEVQALEFPAEEHTFTITDEAYNEFVTQIEKGSING